MLRHILFIAAASLGILAGNVSAWTDEPKTEATDHSALFPNFCTNW